MKEIKEYQLGMTRAPYNGEIHHTTESAKEACNWAMQGHGNVGVVTVDGEVYSTLAVNSRVPGKYALECYANAGECVGCIDPYEA
jgi:hypothetical protein